MTCKDCIHYRMCPTWDDYNDCEYEEGEWCAEYDKELKDYVYFADFKDKSKFIELPCKVGDVVYEIREAFGIVPLKILGLHLIDEEMFSRPKRYSYVVAVSMPLNFSNRLKLKDYNKTWFTENSKAEAKLKELNNESK